MAFKLYMDENIPLPITNGLRLQNVDVLTAQEDGCDATDDEFLLLRATELDRIFFSQDADLLRIASRFQNEGITFTGLIYVHQTSLTVGECIQHIVLLGLVFIDGELVNSVEYL